MMTNKSKWLVVVAVAAATCLVFAASAMAEFKGAGKASSGSSEPLDAKIEAGGATIYCGETETKGGPEWTIEKEGKAVEKGPDLDLEIKTWGRCETEVEGVTRSVTTNECKIEARQAKEEATGPASILSACSYKFETKKVENCEIKIPSTENSERSDVVFADGGAGDENLSMELALTSVTTTVNAACEAAGIKATHSAKLTGWVEALQNSPQRPNPLWGFAVPMGSTSHIRGLNNTTRIQVVNRQGVASAGPGNNFTAAIEVDAGNNPFFSFATMTVAQCQTFMYERNGGGANDRCTMTAKYILNSGQTWRFTRLTIVSAGGEVEAVAWVAGANY